MNDTEVGRLLDTLEFGEQEMSAAYEVAITKMHTEDMAREFAFFRDVHDAHVMTFSDMTDKMGWPRGGPSDADRSRAEASRRAVEKARDQDTTVDALLEAEKGRLDEYRRALDSDLPDDVRAVLSRQADDEMRHVEYLMRHTAEMSALTPASTRFNA